MYTQHHYAKVCLSVVLIGLSLLTFGCSSSQQAGNDQWSSGSAITGQMEYRIDSLANENRRLKQQIDAVSTENKNLTARTAELDAKLKETKMAPPVSVQQTAAPAPTKDITSGYSGALDTYQKRNFTEAAKQFESLLSGGIGEDLADNCHYWIGESYYGMGKYNDAIHHFQEVLGYKHSEKRDDAQLMIGNCYAAMGNKASAKEAYNKLISSYPASTYVKKAKDKLAKMK
jgi:tol-pal system protein YbgF